MKKSDHSGASAPQIDENAIKSLKGTITLPDFFDLIDDHYAGYTDWKRPNPIIEMTQQSKAHEKLFVEYIDWIGAGADKEAKPKRPLNYKLDLISNRFEVFDALKVLVKAEEESMKGGFDEIDDLNLALELAKTVITKVEIYSNP